MNETAQPGHHFGMGGGVKNFSTALLSGFCIANSSNSFWIFFRASFRFCLSVSDKPSSFALITLIV